jgi:internalin A
MGNGKGSLRVDANTRACDDDETWNGLFMDGLEVLSVTNTKVTDSGVGRLVKLSNLRELTLDRTLVTDQGLDVLKSLMQLRVLTLTGTQVPRDGVKAIRSALPWLDVTY